VSAPSILMLSIPDWSIAVQGVQFSEVLLLLLAYPNESIVGTHAHFGMRSLFSSFRAHRIVHT
jgi:hypothetical protein